MTRRRILVVSWGLMGDTIMATPALRALRRGLPDAHLAFSCNAPWAPLFDDRAVCDEVLPVRPRTWKGVMGALLRRPRDLARLAAPGWDVLLDLGGGGNVIRLARRVRAERMISMRADPHAAFHGIVDASVRHQCDRCLAVAAQAGAIGDDRSYLLARVEPDATAWTTPGRRVAINPGASVAAKRWPAERFAALAAELAARGCTVVVVWGPGERELAERICAASPAVLAPPTSPLGLARVLAAAELCVTGDSGPMHLAAGVGCAVVALFSTSDPAIYTPPGRVTMVRHPGAIDAGGMAVAEVSAAAAAALAQRP